MSMLTSISTNMRMSTVTMIRHRNINMVTSMSIRTAMSMTTNMTTVPGKINMATSTPRKIMALIRTNIRITRKSLTSTHIESCCAYYGSNRRVFC